MRAGIEPKADARVVHRLIGSKFILNIESALINNKPIIPKSAE
jgi:hypothetical protein